MVKKTKDMTEKVMAEIQEKGIKMRPRLYFMAGSLLLGAGLAGAMALAVFFINLVAFQFRVQAPLGFLWLGRFGLRPFFQNIPWRAGLLALGGIVGGLFLLKKHEVSYRKSFFGLALGLIGLVVVLGLVLSRIGFNERACRARLMGPLYQHQFAGQDWVMGRATRVEEKEIEIITPDGKKVTLVWDESTRWPLSQEVVVGDPVRAVGERERDLFWAQGVVPGRETWRRLWFKKRPKLHQLHPKGLP